MEALESDVPAAHSKARSQLPQAPINLVSRQEDYRRQCPGDQARLQGVATHLVRALSVLDAWLGNCGGGGSGADCRAWLCPYRSSWRTPDTPCKRVKSKLMSFNSASTCQNTQTSYMHKDSISERAPDGCVTKSVSAIPSSNGLSETPNQSPGLDPQEA